MGGLQGVWNGDPDVVGVLVWGDRWVGGFAFPFVVRSVVVVVVDFDDRWQVQLLQSLRKKGIFFSPPN